MSPSSSEISDTSQNASSSLDEEPLNGYPKTPALFQVGVSEDKGARRTMEDAHSFVVDFDSIHGQGFFAVFDGHAGRDAADWCGNKFHERLLAVLHTSPSKPIPEVLNETFHNVDETLSEICENSGGTLHSGCTAVTAFLRIEDSDGLQSFLGEAPLQEVAMEAEDPPRSSRSSPESDTSQKTEKVTTPIPSSPPPLRRTQLALPPSTCRRVLYTANAGDARAVLCRTGKAIRLTYDHKGTDKREAKRITDAGGFVLSGRVNGVLAVTRSLGDSSMKEFVVGSPYTTETELSDEDEFLILACDGLWDVITDQGAVDLVRDIHDAKQASRKLLKRAFTHHTTDNVTVIVVRFQVPESRNTV